MRECSRYEGERACLRENIEIITGMKVEEMDREDQRSVILGFQKRKQELVEVMCFLEKMWSAMCSAEKNRRQI